MRSRLACLLLLLFLLPALAPAQSRSSQARMESDCRQRLSPLVPAGVTTHGVAFTALGNYATYYVVTVRFTGNLENGKRSAACTYRRDGEWVRDDAAAHALLRELDAARARGKSR